ncbi:hypothetical protein HY312_00515 [Candidatus Saccharibacteria bacterium]|nr:hypothetical protein [Candidatus Saccharibacteria bacterium]
MPADSASAQSASLSITPKKNYVIEPGKTVKDKLTIRNLDGEKQLDLTLRVVDFTFRDDGGTPKLMLDQNAQPTTWSLKPFLNLPKTVSIPAKGSKTVDMSLSIPAKHGAGSYYSAIVYSSGTPEEGGNVGLNASGVTLAFVNIPGAVKEDLKVEKFGAYVDSTEGQSAGYTSLTMSEPVRLAYTLKNNGNVTEAPVGTITLKSMFGTEYKIEEVNPSASLALIGQSRTFSACIKLSAQEVDFNGTKSEAKNCTSPGLWPGYYSASLNLFYGQNGNTTKELASTAGFWYLPLWFVIIVLVLLAAVGIGIWIVVRKVRGHVSHSKSKRTRR